MSTLNYAIHTLAGQLGSYLNFSTSSHDIENLAIVRAMEKTSIQDCLTQLHQSPFINKEHYLTYSASRKNAGFTYLDNARFNNEYHADGMFYGLCYFASPKEIDFAIMPEQLPEHLWRTDTEVLTQESYKKNKVTDIIYEPKTFNYNTKDGINIGGFETNGTFSNPNQVNGFGTGEIQRFILVSDFLNWYNAGANKQRLTDNLHAIANQRYPLKLALTELLADINTSIGNKAVDDSISPVIFTLPGTSKLSWCFYNINTKTGESITLADGSITTLLFRVSAHQIIHQSEVA